MQKLKMLRPKISGKKKAAPKAARKTGVDSKQELAIARELSYWHFDCNFMFSARINRLFPKRKTG